jgi:hypothetical protein
MQTYYHVILRVLAAMLGLGFAEAQAAPTVLTSGLTNPQNIFVDSSSVYWIAGPSQAFQIGSISKTPGGGAVINYSGRAVDPGSVDLVQDNVFLYYIGSSDANGGPYVCKVPKSGGSPSADIAGTPFTTLQDSVVSGPIGIGPVGGILYFNSLDEEVPNDIADIFQDIVSLSTLGGSTTVLTYPAGSLDAGTGPYGDSWYSGLAALQHANLNYFPGGSPQSFSADSTDLFWSDGSDIWSMPLIAGLATPIVSGRTSIRFIATPTTGAAAGSIFWVEGNVGSGSLMRCDVFGQVTTLLTGIIAAGNRCFAVANDRVFCEQQGGLVEVSIYGGTPVVLASITQAFGPVGVAADGTYIYWSNDSGQIMRLAQPAITPATVTLGNLTATYNGATKAVTATTNPANLSTVITYNGSSTAPSTAGSYTVVVSVNDLTSSGTATGTLVIAKAAATVTLGSLTATYDGTPKAATATTTPSGLNVTFTYNGSSTAPTAAGNYTVVGTINDSNYQGTATGTLVIGAPPIAYVTLDPTGDTSSMALAVSGSNVVGYYNDSASVQHGFLYNGTTYTTLDPPGSTATTPLGVSTNEVAGYYVVDNLVTHGFLYNGGTYTTLDPPGSVNTQAAGVSGTNVAGQYTDGSGVTHGFLYNGSTYATLNAPGSVSTQAFGISGTNVVGQYTDGSGVTHGFLYNGSTYTKLDPSGTTSTDAIGISGANVVGQYTDGSGVKHGFLYNGGTYTVIDPPGTTGTFASGISGSNIAGAYKDSGEVVHGFLYSGGTYTLLDPPDTTSTYAFGVSGNSIVGWYTDASEVTHALIVMINSATVTLGNLTATYNGTPKAATATTTPSGLNVTFTYNGSSTAPTNAGSYTVVGTINDPKYLGSTTGTLVIAQAPATVNLGNLTATYNGTAKAATATTSPSSLSVTFTYNGSGTAPTNAGSYTVIGTVNDINYSGSATGSLVIGQAAQTITFSSIGSQYYPGPTLALSATATSGQTVDFSVTSGPATIPLNSNIATFTGTGVVKITASQPGDADYLAASSMTQSITVNPSPNLTFNEWEARPGVFTSTQLADPSISGPTASPEKDGVPNLLKYLYNINPAAPMTASDRAALPVLGTTTTGGTIYLTLIYGRYALETGITINVQTSPNLQNWTTLGLTTGTPNSTQYIEQPTGQTDPNGDPYMEIEVPATGSRKFIRLNVTQP